MPAGLGTACLQEQLEHEEKGPAAPGPAQRPCSAQGTRGSAHSSLRFRNGTAWKLEGAIPDLFPFTQPADAYLVREKNSVPLFKATSEQCAFQHPNHVTKYRQV